MVPAGRGKSRIHAAMSHMFFKHTEAHIIVLFENKGLLNRDMKQNELFEIFKEADKSAYAKRLSTKCN